MVHFAAASNTGTSLFSWKRRTGATAMVLVAAFIWGFAAETTSLFDQFWPGMLWMGALPLLLTAALAASFGKKVMLPTAVVFGVVAGFLTAIMFLLGVFSPFALELGERDLNELGADEPWDVRLTWGLILYGAGGAVLGAVCGIAAWALHFGLRQKGLGGERDTREAGR